MVVTLFLLGAVYALLIGVLFAAGAGGVTILVVAGGLLALQFFTSDKLALRSMGAHQVSPQEAPQLHALIERLCVQATVKANFAGEKDVGFSMSGIDQKLTRRPTCERHSLNCSIAKFDARLRKTSVPPASNRIVVIDIRSQ